MASLLLSACLSKPQPAPRSELQSEPDQPTFSIPTAIPLQTPIAPAATLPPPAPIPATEPAELAVEPSAERAATLLDLAPGDGLQLVADLPVPRTDFGVRLAFSPDGHMLLHSGGGMLIQRYDLDHNRPAGDLTGFQFMSPLTISVSSDGSAVAADDGSQIRLWNSQTGEQLNPLELPPISALTNAGFYGDRLYYTVDYQGNVLIWDPQNWGQITRFSYPGRVDGAVLYPDGDSIALLDRDRNLISIFDVDGTPLRAVEFEGVDPRLVSISPTGDRFLLHVDYGLPSEGVAVISAETGQTEYRLDLLNFRHFAVSADWQLLAAAGVDNELRLYSLPTGEHLVSQSLGAGQTRLLRMAPNSEYLGLFTIMDLGQGGAIQVWGPDPSS